MVGIFAMMIILLIVLLISCQSIEDRMEDAEIVYTGNSPELLSLSGDTENVEVLFVGFSEAFFLSDEACNSGVYLNIRNVSKDHTIYLTGSVVNDGIVYDNEFSDYIVEFWKGETWVEVSHYNGSYTNTLTEVEPYISIPPMDEASRFYQVPIYHPGTYRITMAYWLDCEYLSGTTPQESGHAKVLYTSGKRYTISAELVVPDIKVPSDMLMDVAEVLVADGAATIFLAKQESFTACPDWSTFLLSKTNSDGEEQNVTDYFVDCYPVIETYDSESNLLTYSSSLMCLEVIPYSIDTECIYLMQLVFVGDDSGEQFTLQLRFKFQE